MNSRQKKILESIITIYTRCADPVGSHELVRDSKLDISPATVRNEMKALEREGYIFQPHTSAGRVPTDKGYRFYVNDLLQRKRSLSRTEQGILRGRIDALERRMDHMLQASARLLADLSRNAAISGGERESYRYGLAHLLKQPEFQDTRKALGIAELMEEPEAYLKQIAPAAESDIKIYIGQENPDRRRENCSIIVSRFSDSTGEKGCIAILGPTRMSYDRNIALIKYMSRLLAGGAFAFVLFVAF